MASRPGGVVICRVSGRAVFQCPVDPGPSRTRTAHPFRTDPGQRRHGHGRRPHGRRKSGTVGTPRPRCANCRRLPPRTCCRSQGPKEDFIWPRRTIFAATPFPPKIAGRRNDPAATIRHRWKNPTSAPNRGKPCRLPATTICRAFATSAPAAFWSSPGRSVCGGRRRWPSGRWSASPVRPKWRARSIATGCRSCLALTGIALALVLMIRLAKIAEKQRPESQRLARRSAPQRTPGRAGKTAGRRGPRSAQSAGRHPLDRSALAAAGRVGPRRRIDAGRDPVGRSAERHRQPAAAVRP